MAIYMYFLNVNLVKRKLSTYSILLLVPSLLFSFHYRVQKKNLWCDLCRTVQRKYSEPFDKHVTCHILCMPVTRAKSSSFISRLSRRLSFSYMFQWCFVALNCSCRLSVPSILNSANWTCCILSGAVAWITSPSLTIPLSGNRWYALIRSRAWKKCAPIPERNYILWFGINSLWSNGGADVPNRVWQSQNQSCVTGLALARWQWRNPLLSSLCKTILKF
jgi:hypothetical protein